MQAQDRHNLLLRALILAGLIAFGVFATWYEGLIQVAIDADRSRISLVILALYAAFTAQWFWLVTRLSRERQQVDDVSTVLADSPARRVDGTLMAGTTALPPSLFHDYLNDLFNKAARSDGRAIEHGILLEALGERLYARHSFGLFAADMLLKLGLLGTILGFIMMLAPVGELTDFDPAVLQQLLGQMSGGMAIALYTTMAGLVTSTLLGLQYELLANASTSYMERVAVTVDTLVLPGMTKAPVATDL